jgi:hypothetical protein
VGNVSAIFFVGKMAQSLDTECTGTKTTEEQYDEQYEKRRKSSVFNQLWKAALLEAGVDEEKEEREEEQRRQECLEQGKPYCDPYRARSLARRREEQEEREMQNKRKIAVPEELC